MLELNRTKCCGLRELYGIQLAIQNPNHYFWQVPRPEEILTFVVDQIRNNRKRCAYITFTGAQETGIKQGMALARLIRKEKLGSCKSFNECRNPNSGNQLKAWLWQVDQKRLPRWKAKPVEK